MENSNISRNILIGLLIVKKEVDGNLMFAVYEIDNVRSYLGGLSEIK